MWGGEWVECVAVGEELKIFKRKRYKKFLKGKENQCFCLSYIFPVGVYGRCCLVVVVVAYQIAKAKYNFTDGGP